MARTRDLSKIVQETAPEPTPPPATPPPTRPTQPIAEVTPKPKPALEAERTTRSTLDLPVSQHRALQRYALEVSDRAGRSVRGQHVLRTLVARLLADEDLAEQVARDLSGVSQ